MKPYWKLLLCLGGAVLTAMPLRAEDATPTAKSTATGSATQQTWQEVRELTAELDALIAKKQLAGVHDAALNVRDAVRELRGSLNLTATAQAQLDLSIGKVDSLLDQLHETADHNDLRGTVQHQRRLHVLLDEIAGVFPSPTLKPIGAIVARGNVKDPYCRMTVDPATAAASVAYNGQTYYFCARSEAAIFQKNPAPYVATFDELNFGKPRPFTVGLATPKTVKVGEPTTLALAVREAGKPAIVKQFQLVHEKLMHLIIVSDDLGWFAHEHPQLAPDGKFYFQYSFPRAGRYWLYTDFTPANGANTIARSELRIPGEPNRALPRLKPDTSLTKTVDGYTFTVTPSPSLQAGRQSLLTYTITRNGQPVTDMEPYLGAMGHMIAVHQNGRDVVHTHTVSAGIDSETGLSVSPEMATARGPRHTYKLELPTAGIYRIWAQFGHRGQVLTVPFTFKVTPNPNKELPMNLTSKSTALLAAGAVLAGTTILPTSQAAPGKEKPAKTKIPKIKPSDVQRVTITLPADYKNNLATVKAGKPLALTFFLKSDAGCGNEVVVPAANNWKRKLVVGKKVTVAFTPTKSGPLTFACSMGHMKGSLLVK